MGSVQKLDAIMAYNSPGILLQGALQQGWFPKF